MTTNGFVNKPNETETVNPEPIIFPESVSNSGSDIKSEKSTRSRKSTNPKQPISNTLVKSDTSADDSAETQNTEDVLGETVELLGAVGDLTRDAYIGAARKARGFVNFLHNQIKPSGK